MADAGLIGSSCTRFGKQPARSRRAAFDGGIGQLDPAGWMADDATADEDAGKPFHPKDRGGTLFMDTDAMQAAWHIKHHGTTPAQIA